MKGKLILCHVLCTAIGCIAGALAASGMGVFGGALLAVVVAAVLGAVGISKIVAEEEDIPTMKPVLKPAVQKAPAPVAPEPAKVQHSDMDLLGLSEEMAFASQQVVWGINQFEVALKKLGDLSNDISSKSENNASSLEEASAGVMEIAGVASDISETAQSSMDQCHSSTSLVEKYQHEVNEVTLAIKNVGQVVQAAVNDIDELNNASEKIANFVEKIRGIASQTNLLALNAAIEAARAGEHGKGFAVVAEEVRNLAARSAKAAKETTDMIEGSMAKVETGREIAHKTADALNAIVGDVSSVADIVANIAKASNEQKLALEQINQGVQQVSQVVQANSSTSEEAATASQNLNQQADIMRANVGKFRLSNSGSSFYGGNGGSAIQKPDLTSAGRQPAVVPAKPGVKPRTIALTDDEGFGKY